LASAPHDLLADDRIDVRLTAARRWARAAGAVLMEWRGTLTTADSRVQNKSTFDLVTAADEASEALIVDAIASEFPGDAILAEEGSSRPGTSGFQWVIDPLDGTTNFVHAHPIFMVAIGLRFEGWRVAGVCYAPVLDELYAARLGAGATRNGLLIGVSRTSELLQSLLATGFPYDRRTGADELLAVVGRALREAQGLRRLGSACYELCLVAAGVLDGFFERGLQPWDVCAASLIVDEAGGVLSAYDGGDFDIAGRSVVASNGPIHSDLLSRILQGP